MNSVKDDPEKKSLDSVGGVISPSDDGSYDFSQTQSKNWIKRTYDGFKPPLDHAHFADLTPQDRAAVYLDRASPKLARRHLMVISLSSCVGTGLFIGTRTSLTAGGPAGLLLGFGIMGVALVTTMSTVGEISLRYPTINVFYEIPARFLHPSWGFAVGWLYAICWMVTAPLELIAAAQLTQFWKNDNNAAAKANPVAWVALLYVFTIVINISGSRAYGELEFIIGLIKVTAVMGFIIYSIIEVCGGPPHNQYMGVENFYSPKPFMNSFKGVVQALITCSLAYGGTEVSAVAAAETKNPHKAIPSAVKQAFWRIVFFFILAVFMMCLMVSPVDKRIGSDGGNGTGSPFIVALQATGVRALPSIMNAVIICSVIGVSNAGMYAASRTLTSLAVKGANLSWFCYIDRQGRPLVSIIAVAIFSLISFVAASDKYNEVFDWLYAFAALAFLFAWCNVNICYLRIHRAYKVQGRSLSEFLYRSPLGVPGAVIGMLVTGAVIALQFWIYLFPIGKSPDPEYFFKNDLSIPVLIALLVGHKAYFWKTSKFISDKDLDLDSGVRDVDYDEMRNLIAEEKEMNRRNIIRRIVCYLC